jgi:DNA polymerase III sliding clamp (beta) subunit (PCNA family)
MNTETLSKVLSFIPIISTDPSRYSICAVRLQLSEKPGDFVKVIATDGHRMTVAEINDPELAPFLRRARAETGGETKSAVSIGSEDLENLKRAKLKGVTSAHYGDLLPNGSWTLELNSQVKVRLFHQDYPDFQAIADVALKNDGFTVAFNAGYLEEMLKALRNDKKQEMVKLVFTDNPLEPIRVEVDGNLGVLMPMNFGRKVQDKKRAKVSA